jgi:hypothetical protein
MREPTLLELCNKRLMRLLKMRAMLRRLEAQRPGDRGVWRERMRLLHKIEQAAEDQVRAVRAHESEVHDGNDR